MTRTRKTDFWTTVAEVGYDSSVSVGYNENPSAHGGVCLLQTHTSAEGRMWGRKVNSNGTHEEVGDSFEMDPATLARWGVLANAFQELPPARRAIAEATYHTYDADKATEARKGTP